MGDKGLSFLDKEFVSSVHHIYLYGFLYLPKSVAAVKFEQINIMMHVLCSETSY